MRGEPFLFLLSSRMMANDLGHDFPGLGTTAKRNKKKDFMAREGRTTEYGRNRTEEMESLRKTPLNLNNCHGFGPSLWSSGRLFYMERKTVHLRPLIAMSTLAKLRPLFKIRKQQTCFRRQSQAKAASTPQGFFWLHSACPSISC